MQTERKKKISSRCVSLSCGCTAAANAVRIRDGIDRWRAPYLPPLLRVPWNPTVRYTSAIKPANAKARQIAGASRKRRQPNGFSLRWEKKKKLAAKGPFGLEEQPESNGSSLVSVPRRGARCPSHGRMQGGFALPLGCLAHFKKEKVSHMQTSSLQCRGECRASAPLCWDGFHLIFMLEQPENDSSPRYIQ